MASISKREVDGKRRYDVNYREPDGRSRRKTFHRKTDADRFAAQVEADKFRGAYVDVDAGRVTFKAYAEEWLNIQTFDVSSHAVTERQLRLHVYPTLGSRQISSIKPSTIQAWVGGLKMSRTYAKAILGTVSSIFGAAVDDEIIRKNPCKADSVRRRAPKPETRRVQPWPAARVQAVAEALPERYRIAATLAAGLGLRQGEVFGLGIGDVDFLRGEVHVRRQIRRLTGGLVFRLPKGDKIRTVPLPSSVRQPLAVYLADHPAQAVSLPWDVVDGDPVEAQLIMTRADGQAMRSNSFDRDVWGPALAKAGVEKTRDAGMHALRHWYASVLLDAGESIKAVSEYLGHSDPGFTLRTYTHLMPSSVERTKRAIDGALGCYIGGTSQTG